MIVYALTIKHPNGGGDIVIEKINPSEEGRKRVFFSTGYFEESLYLYKNGEIMLPNGTVSRIELDMDNPIKDILDIIHDLQSRKYLGAVVEWGGDFKEHVSFTIDEATVEVDLSIKKKVYHFGQYVM